MGMYKLNPACKDYLWGGKRLIVEYGIQYDGGICAEAWVLSCHKDGQSKIASDIEKSKSLAELVRSNKAILGTNCDRFEDFPILIKLIDAKKKLSIQVHPDDEYAIKNENQYGKTEMWYVLEAKEGSYLYLGFEKEIDKEEFIERIANNTLTDVLHKQYVKRGDVIFISPGTVHAIGEGIVVAEIQQNSNITYRIYDYGRVGADGKPRELNIEKALDVIKLKRPADYSRSDEHLALCDYFCVDKVEITEGNPFLKRAGADSFVSILVISGCCTVSSGSETIIMKKGDSLFVEANTGEFKVEGNAELILTSIPQKE